MFLLLNLFYGTLGYGRRRSQRLFAKLHSQAIYGMNYSNPAFEMNGELEAMRYVHRRLAALNIEKPVIYDVGANVGDYTVELQRLFPHAAIHCFEPGSVSFKRLAARTAPMGNVVVQNFGFGEAAGNSTLFLDAPASKTASVYHLPPNHPWKERMTESIRLETVDGYSNTANIDRIHFLKIDVEGHELSVLKGAENMLRAGKLDFIQFEFGFRQIDSRTYFRDFFQLLNPQYVLYRILRDGLLRIDHYHEGLEIFVLVSNFLAERRI